MAAAIVTRTATVDDVDFMVANLQAGFATYVEFAPEGWRPPPPDREQTLARLGEPDTWALLVTVDGAAAGHVGFHVARGNPFEDPDGWREGPSNPGEAHLWHLFVLPDHWGSGVADVLHGAALETMEAQGYERARLFTPAGNARARRFYERRGWRSGYRLTDPALKLEMVEYRVELSDGRAPPGPGRP
jgi:ribosomal protein S18 acetylase RimI-like enzyme